MRRRELLTGSAALALSAGAAHAFGVGRLGLGEGHLGGLGGAGSPASGAPFPAPPGFHWDFVQNLSDGQRVIDFASGQPVITLVGN